MTTISRRRFVAISAAAGGALLSGMVAAAARPYVWTGTALGAEASIRIDGVDALDTGERIAARARREMQRLEGLFSLYRSDSAISELNRTGVLAAPDPDLLELMSLARTVHAATSGAFDPTVQPQWTALAEHYASSPNAGNAAAPAGETRAAGFDHVRIGPARIAFERSGMAITLNGIAQGFVTDRIADLLRAEGLINVLVHVGEFRANGPQRDGSGWPIGIRTPGQADSIVATIRLSRSALATSEPRGTTFDEAGRVGHILNPRTGLPATQRQSVSVEAPKAAIADALSTAFCVMDDRAITAALKTFPGARLVHKA